MGDQTNTEQLDAEADSIITWAAARAGVIVLAPVVGGSFLVANEIYMIVRIGQVYGQQLTTSAAGGFVVGMAGMVGGQLLAGLFPIPGFSTLVGMGTTFAMGHAAKAWIKDGTPSDVKRYKEVAAKARAEADRISDQLKNDPRRNQPLGDESKKF